MNIVNVYVETESLTYIERDLGMLQDKTKLVLKTP